jgi:hypothetical protein
VLTPEKVTGAKVELLESNDDVSGDVDEVVPI